MTKGFELDNRLQKYTSVSYAGSSIELVPGEKPPRRGKSRLIIIAVIAVLVIALIIGLAVGLTKKDDDDDANTAKQSEGDQTTSKPLSADWMDVPCSNHRSPPKCPWKGVNPVLLISTDGFYGDYMQRNISPVLQKLRSCGVYTPNMRSVYPTVTIPNHYALSTGLYPPYSGIIDNSMYDPIFNRTFTPDNEEVKNPEWWGGEPLWITAKKQGKKSASYMWYWVASTVNISGVLPDYVVPYNMSVPYEERVDTVIEWLKLDEDLRPDLITLYFVEPDEAGHEYGPSSPQVDEMVKKMDATFHRLMNGLYRNGLDGCVNVIITSDHGMSETSCERQVPLHKYIKDIDKMLVTDGTRGSIRGKFKPVNDTVFKNDAGLSSEEIVDALECKNLHLNVFTNATLPVRLHHTHRRIGDVVIRMDDRWIVSQKEEKFCIKGDHGYDNIFESMAALFMAHGPDFKHNLTAEPFERIELYNLMAEILDLKPAPNNGTAGSLSYMLQGEPKVPEYEPSFQPKECNVMTTRNRSTCNCGVNVPYKPANNVINNVFPFGVPVLENNVSMCKFNGHQFTSIYSLDKNQPALASFIVTSEQVQGYNSSAGSCIHPDPRVTVEVNPDCTMYENTTASLVHTQLFDPDLSTSSESLKDSQLSTNMVPMYSGFKDGIWRYLWRLIREYASEYNTLHVSIGPVFDANFDGRADGTDVENRFVKDGSSVVLPTHYYAILTKCSQTVSNFSSCKMTDIQTLAFVLPHINKTTNCEPNKDYLRDNVVRIKDIEVLTGFRFLTRLDRLESARIRTVLQTDLWPTALLTPWVDLPCPIPEDTKCPAGKIPLLLICLDGFRADYLERHLTPVIERLAKCGVHTPYMRSVYPTVTFPNHYTIVTGLYPESHGIVGNSMYDEDIDKLFSLSAPTAKDPRWWKGEPLWNTAMKQGLKTATYFWPGSDVNISGMYPDIYKPYDGKAGYTSRVYEVLDWLTLPVDERPDFMTLYFDEPDHAGHNGGPKSEEVNGQLETVDELINILMTNLYERDLHNCVNMIIVADHGMSNQSCDRKVMLKNYLPDVNNMLVFDRTMANIFPEFKADNRNDAHRQNISNPVKDIVANLTCKHSAMKAFTSDTLPRRHHFMNNPRIGDVMVDMKDEWIVLKKNTNWCDGGNHGWDNTFKHMHALFLAHGPAFKSDFRTDAFENIELYNLMAEILNITAAPNNGTHGSLSHFLRNPTNISVDTNKQEHGTCNTQTGVLSTICQCQEKHNISSSDVYLADNKKILMFGVPTYERNDSVCLLHQVGSSTAFSKIYNSPIWLTTMVSNKTSSGLLNNSSCTATDSRVIYWNSTKCQSDLDHPNITMEPLIDLGIKETGKTTYLSSSMIPMYTGFRTGIWMSIKKLINDYTEIYGDISVISGPLYDYNNDGLLDQIKHIKRYLFNNTASHVPVPTHIFVSLVKCKTNGESLPCNGKLDILSFILPHTSDVLNCLSPKAYLKDNVARLRDIELMSGTQFMTSYNSSYSARLRTYLPEALWRSTMYREWKDLPCPHQNQCTSDYKPVLLISLDGFRADYLLRNLTPTIARLSQCGVHAPYMRSVYPTKTFPNHYSIVTGLYPESHGIIDNNMYDVSLQQRFSLGSAASKNPKWWDGEPIWLTAKKHGLKTATYFWPGSDVQIHGEYPDHWKDYNGKVSYYERVKKVLAWMSLPEGKRPEFITLYYDEPDLAGHKYGPDGQGVNDALQRVDDIIGLLMEGLVQKNLHNCVNMVIIADHGMADIDCKRIVRLKEHVDYSYLSGNTWVWEGSFGRIANTYLYNRSSSNQISPALNPVSTEGIFNNLTCASPHLDMYRKSSLPVRHHYSNNDRIDDIILDVDSDWLVARSFSRSCQGGSHGYDNIAKSMQALFLAYGPAFKWNYSVEAFENIELYNMFTEILNMTGAPNNGTMGSLNHILQSPPSDQGFPLFYGHVVGAVQWNKKTEYVQYVQSVLCKDICTKMSEKLLGDLYDGVVSAVRDPTHIEDLPKLRQREHYNTNVTILQHKDFVIGYDKSIDKTIWMKGIVKNTTKVKLDVVDCLTPDPRIPPQTCLNTKSQNMKYGPLLSIGEGLHQMENLATLYASMRLDFYTDVWSPLQQMMGDWSVRYGDLEVLTGPVYDYNHDSLPDNATTIRMNGEPSHFYTIISRCVHKLNTGCMKYQSFSVIIPHSKILNCKTFEAYLEDNECRIRDIEIITGLQFFTELKFDESVRLRTYLPNGPWDM